jgi:hypothetical protein
VHDQNSRSTMRSILCNGAMILGAIVWIEWLIDHKNRIKTIRDIINSIIHIRNGFEWIYNEEKFKLLAR